MVDYIFSVSCSFGYHVLYPHARMLYTHALCAKLHWATIDPSPDRQEIAAPRCIVGIIHYKQTAASHTKASLETLTLPPQSRSKTTKISSDLCYIDSIMIVYIYTHI
jgi:hypothetical protein